LVQEADIRARLHDRRFDELARVLTAPPFPLAEDEDLVEELERVGDRLGRLAVVAHPRQQCFDVLRVDSVQMQLAERRLAEMRSERRVIGAEGGRLQALRLEMPQKALTGFGNRDLGAGVLRLLGINQLAQRLLGFATGQSLFAAAGPYRPDLAIGAAGAVMPAPVPPIPTMGIGAALERAGAVAAATIAHVRPHERRRCAAP
jgi:hypothetical protein